MSADTCVACRHFSEVESKRGTDDDLGECRRFPPTITGYGDEDDVQQQARPFVWGSEYCGEFMRRLVS